MTMTTDLPENDTNLIAEEEVEEEEEKEEKKRRWLLLLLLSLLVLLCCAGGLFWRYIQQPVPLPEMLPLPLEVNYPPHYVFSIYEVDRPVGVALSPEGDRIYVAETGGERLVKMFDRDGDLLGSFAPPRTRPGERSPVYLATDRSGRVFVADRLQHAVFVYDESGTYLDTILGPALTLSEYVSKHVDGLQPGDMFTYELFEPEVVYQKLGDFEQTLPAPDPVAWSPLGIRFDRHGKLLLTDVAAVGFNVIREIPAEVMQAASWQEFNPPESMFGAYGAGNGQFVFPNSAVADSQGRIYVSDGNNSRISSWDGRGNFRFHFAQGSGDGALGLPRGAAIDGRDRLYVVDAVGQNVKAYDVSGEEPVFLFIFGDIGLGDGQFNYPNDIALDTSGRLYIADRENNRIQVWSY
jgi:sugar lactone lactonase YvrE